MNRDFHDIDELFREGLDNYKEIPNSSVMDSLVAALDKKDAEQNRKRLVILKRAALFLLLLLTGFALYESGIIRIGGSKSTAKNESADLLVQQNQNQIKSRQENPLRIATEYSLKNTAPKKNDWVKVYANSMITEASQEFLPVSSVAEKKLNDGRDYKIELPTRKPGLIILNHPAISYSPLIADNNNNTGMKKVNQFNPFWMATAFFSYDQAGYKLDSDEPSAASSIKFREAHEPSFSLGLLMTRQMSPRWGFQSGIIYSNIAIGMKPQKVYAFADPTGDIAYKYITSSGFAFIKPGFGPSPSVGDSLNTAEAKHRIEHISIPLVVRHTLLNNKISITPGAGIEANFTTKARLEVDIEDPFNREIVVVRKLNATKSFYFSIVADAEIKYNVSKKLSINLRPVYRHAISPTTNSNVVETYPRSFGLGAGVTIRL